MMNVISMSTRAGFPCMHCFRSGVQGELLRALSVKGWLIFLLAFAKIKRTPESAPILSRIVLVPL